MGVLKFIGKTIGTVVLTTTGTASAVLKGVSDAVGFEIGSDVLGIAKNASFNGVRSIWEGNNLTCIDKMETLDYSVENSARKQAENTAKIAKKKAEEARMNGNMEEYERYMERYEYYMDLANR